MNRPFVSPPSAVTPDRPQQADTRLRGPWLVLARTLWLAVAALSVSLFAAGVVADFARLQIPCPTNACLSTSGQLTPTELRALTDLGLSLGFYAAYAVTLDVVFATVYVVIAALIFWRPATDRFALFVALALLTFGTATFPYSFDALLAALEQLITLLEEARDYAAAIGYAQLLLRHDPLHEGAYQHLMRLHAVRGDRAGALRVYHTCVSVLERELAVEPSSTTRDAYERLMATAALPAPPEMPQPGRAPVHGSGANSRLSQPRLPACFLRTGRRLASFLCG